MSRSESGPEVSGKASFTAPGAADIESGPNESVIDPGEDRQLALGDDDEDEFIRKYGEIDFQYISPQKNAVWFIRPHALNYFKDGVLYRTKGERSSSRTELFLDLMYVGIIANLAGDASEHASGAALLKYILLFIPAWVVWADIKDFTNYYYNEDLSQKLYIMWILALLALYANSHGEVLKDTKGAALTIVPYILCRLSLSASLTIYSFYIPQHRPQMRIYAATIVVTCCLWIIVIFVGTRAKIGVSIAIMAMEQICFSVCYHPWIKKKLNLTMLTALNIEHEVERFSVFVTIAIGEFLYKVVASSPLGAGFSSRFARGIFLLIIAYILFWLYMNGSTAKRAIHPLRYRAWTAITWIYAHLPLIASLVLAADAGGDLILRSSEYHPHETAERRLESSGEEEAPLKALSLFFTGGICVSLISVAVIGLLDQSKDPSDMHYLPKFWRIIWRIPIGGIILALSFAEMDITVMMGVIVALLGGLLIFESVMLTPKECFKLGISNLQLNCVEREQL